MTAIDTSIFARRTFSGTPDRLSPPLLSLAHELAPAATPAFVPCVPDGEPAECFFNVRKKVERDGGELLNGWALWEWRNVFVEAEHHAVWRDGTILLDVTPHTPSEERILFVPDPGRRFDFEGLNRMLNVKRSLGLIPAASAYLDATDRLASYVEASSRGRLVTMRADTAFALRSSAQRACGLVLDNLARITKPNDACICRSGRKFKKCCGPLIRLDS